MQLHGATSSCQLLPLHRLPALIQLLSSPPALHPLIQLLGTLLPPLHPKLPQAGCKRHGRFHFLAQEGSERLGEEEAQNKWLPHTCNCAPWTV